MNDKVLLPEIKEKSQQRQSSRLMNREMIIKFLSHNLKY